MNDRKAVELKSAVAATSSWYCCPVAVSPEPVPHEAAGLIPFEQPKMPPKHTPRYHLLSPRPYFQGLRPCHLSLLQLP